MFCLVYLHVYKICWFKLSLFDTWYTTSTSACLQRQGYLIVVRGNVTQEIVRGTTAKETETSLLQAIRLFKPLPEMEYNSRQKENNCSWQDSMMFASYTRLVSKNYCSAKLLYASMTSREHQRYKIGLTVPLHLGVPWFLKNWKTYIAPEAMDSNLINQWCKTFKAGRPGHLLDFLQFPIFYFWISVYASQSSKQTWNSHPVSSL